MGYQALLFCPDEKLARVVTQVFGDLEFVVDPVHEPFAAVKKLMAQRFDAIVVDCENEQNASLLFKSARNSTSNQSTLAIALVEGQAGVAKAYRIGANLVLTKPINVEQAKGTLRVARGLLRKNSDASGTASTASAPAAPAAASSSVNPNQPSPRAASPTPGSTPRIAAVRTPTPAIRQTPVTVPENLPAIAASAQMKDVGLPTPPASGAAIAPSAPIEPSISAEKIHDGSADIGAQPTIRPDVAVIEVAPQVTIASVPAPATSPSYVTTGSAAAPALAKEAPAKEGGVSAATSAAVASEPEKAVQDSGHTTPPASASQTSEAPSFGMLSEEASAGSGNKNKILVAAGILVLAAIGYFAYGKLNTSSTATSAPQNNAQSAPVAAPSAAPVSALSNPAQPGGSAMDATTPKTSAAVLPDKTVASAGTSPTLRIAANPEPQTQKPAAAPIVVKSSTATAKTPASSDESAPALPNADVAASASDSSLTGLLPTASSFAKPSLATIKISQGVSQGLVIKRVAPVYPQAALAVHAQGAVQIEATITKEGNVTNLKVLSGDAVLARAAVDAVRQWRYKPYYLDGQPVEIQTQITVNFKSN
jgi:TonB family protein